MIDTEQGSERMDKPLSASSVSLVEVRSPEGTDVTSYGYVLVRGSHEGVLEVLMTEEKVGGRLDIPKNRADGEQRPEETARRTLRFKARWRPPHPCLPPVRRELLPYRRGSQDEEGSLLLGQGGPTPG